MKKYIPISFLILALPFFIFFFINFHTQWWPQASWLSLTASVSQTQSTAGDYATTELILNTMKISGCVAEGLFSNYAGSETDHTIDLINRSQCKYLWRAVETWAWPPDFNSVQSNMNKISKQGMIYGMNLAEAISSNAAYYYPDEERNFNFASMCKSGSENYWGENTCKPSFQTSEYRKYLIYIMEKAIDMGVQDFTLGQIYMQDDRSDSSLDSVFNAVRAYASSNGKTIVIGAQTNNITDEIYLRKFDYIEGGVGEYSDGHIENGACSSKPELGYPSSCWALLWNSAYASKANNVILAPDWAGVYGDDMTVFSRMDHNTRISFLQNMYSFFTSQNIGFLMPFLSIVSSNGGGCYGPNASYYSPDNMYACKDEDQINSILPNTTPPPPPTNLNAVCNPAGNQVTLSWSAVAGAVNYQVRVNNTTNDNSACADGWFCADPPDKIVNNYVPVSYTITVIPNQAYNWWVHSSNTIVSSNPVLSTFTCLASDTTPPATPSGLLIQ